MAKTQRAKPAAKRAKTTAAKSVVAAKRGKPTKPSAGAVTKPVVAAKRGKPIKPSAGAVTKPVVAAKRGKPIKPSAGAVTKPVVAAKRGKPTKPSIALPPPPPPPPPQRDELPAPRDVGRLLRYGERFGPHKIDVRMLPLQLPSTGHIAVFDPAVPKSWRVLERPVGAGRFGVMLSIARTGDRERLAAVVIHLGRQSIARWTVAHYQGQKRPRSEDQIPRVPITSGVLGLLDAAGGSPGAVVVAGSDGIAPVEVPLTDGRRALAFASGNGELAAYWAIDDTDKPVCLVIDFDAFTAKEWKAKPT
ncbi:MAG: DUF4241 domain-containing protein [Kofleriaceae bacterium]